MSIGSNNTGAVVGSTGVVATSQAAQKQAKLEAGAHDFEAMMLQQMLKPLKFGEAESSDEEETSGASGTVQGFATDAIAKGIASKGGLGIATQIIKQITVEANNRNGEAKSGEGKLVGTKVW